MENGIRPPIQMAVDGMRNLFLGYAGEQNAQLIQIDVSKWQEKWPGASIDLMLTLPGEKASYPAKTELRDGKLLFLPGYGDTQKPGHGAAYVVATKDGTHLAASDTVLTEIMHKGRGGDELPEAPEAQAGWVAEVLDAAHRAEEAAKRAENAGGGTITDEQVGKAVEDYLQENPVEVPVHSVNGKTGAVQLSAADVGALPKDTPIPAPYALPTASADTKGGVKVGKGLRMDGDVLEAEVRKEDVDKLSEEIDDLKENGGAGVDNSITKDVAQIKDVLDIKEGSATTASLIDFETAAKSFENTGGEVNTQYQYDSANGYVIANVSLADSGVYFAGQKIPVVEGETYTVAAHIKFGDAATWYNMYLGIEKQRIIKNLNPSQGDAYEPGTWHLVSTAITINAETAAKGEARILVMASSNDALPFYIKDLVVVAGSTLPDNGETFETDSQRLVNIETRLDNIEQEVPSSDYKWENPAKQFSALFNNTDNVESFMFFTDPHLAGGSGWETSFTKYTDYIRKVYDVTPTSFCVCGGDWIGNSDTMDAACYKLGRIDARMRSLIREYCPVVGNHDTNYQGKLDASSANYTGTLTNETIRNLWFRREGAAYYRYEGATSAMYVLDSGVEATAMTDYRWQQIDWLAESLKAEKLPNAFIALHIIYAAGGGTTIVPLADYAMAVAEAYNARTTITLNGKTYDFTGCTGKVRFVIGGHTHADATGTAHGIPFVITTQTMQDGVPTFDLVLADYSGGKLHLVRVGEGESRTVTMA